VGALTLLRGNWHSGYDPIATRTAPQTTPLATQSVHAAGFAYAAKRKGEGIAVLCFVGDGATSEGDFHEGLNFAAVFGAPVVYVVQNNGWAISVPLSRQTAAPTLAHKGIGYGIPSYRVDGNDVLAVHTTVASALERARSGGGPSLVEAVTYRMEPHTNADDASRYRSDAEVRAWAHRDPIDRFRAWLRTAGVLDDELAARADEEAEAAAVQLREAMNIEPEIDPLELFDHVLARPTPQQTAQRAMLAAELDAAD
jgi:2-oxoisovalerate dehydrogenase E1 component alpha subunit